MSTRPQPATGSGRQPAIFEQKAFRLDVKDVTAEGEFTGYAAVIGNVDLVGDRIVAGAFTKTISENGEQGWPILWQHDPYEPIGLIGEASEQRKGLEVTGQLNMDVRRGAEAHSLLRQKAIRAMSIGYKAVQRDFEAGVRLLREIKLYEVSLATFPANELALVNSVKSLAGVAAVLDEIKSGRKLDQAERDQVKSLIDEMTSLLAESEGADTDDDEPGSEPTPDVKSIASDALQAALVGITNRRES